MFGSIMAGAVDMDGQISMADGADFFHSLNLADAQVVIVNPYGKDGAMTILQPKINPSESGRKGLFCPTVLSLTSLILGVFPNSGSGERALLDEIRNEADLVVTESSPKDEVVYVCTSGSTGLCKLIPHTNVNILEYGRLFCDALNVGESTVFFNDRPLGWMGGYFYLAKGCATVVGDMRNGPFENYEETIWTIIGNEKCGSAYTTALMLETLGTIAGANPHPGGHKLKICGSGGGPTTKRQMKLSLGTLTENIVTVYASSEGGITAYLRVSDAEEFENFVSGYPCPGSEIKIVHKNLQEVVAGEGEVIFKTSHSATRYVKDLTNTQKSFLPDGWVRLGDIGILNEKKQISILGRDKFSILRGISVIYPDMLEIRIKQCPGVKDVLVTSVPDENLYEEMCVLYLNKQGRDVTPEMFREYCKTVLFSSAVAEYTPIPKYFVAVESFPMMKTGKLDRAAAKITARKLLKL